MSGGFFRGTSADQDTRFSNKTAKLLKTQKFAPELDQLVDITKVNMDVMRPWIATRVTQLLGFEDEVLINFIYELLDGKPGKNVDGKYIQLQITGFMEKNAGKFMRELWVLLLSAQNNISKIPQQFLDEKAEETRQKKAEEQRVISEVKRKEEEKKEAEKGRAKKHDVAPELSEMQASRRSSSPNGERSADDDRVHAGNGKLGTNSSPLRGRSRSRISSKSPSRSPVPTNRRRASRSASRSPRRLSSRSPRRRGRSPITLRRRSRSPRSPTRRVRSPYLRSPRRRHHSPLYSRSPRQRYSRSPRERSPRPSRRWHSPQSSRNPRDWSPIARSPGRHRPSISPRRRKSPVRTPPRYKSPVRTPPRHNRRSPRNSRPSPQRHASPPLRHRQAAASPRRYPGRSPRRRSPSLQHGSPSPPAQLPSNEAYSASPAPPSPQLPQSHSRHASRRRQMSKSLSPAFNYRQSPSDVPVSREQKTTQQSERQQKSPSPHSPLSNASIPSDKRRSRSASVERDVRNQKGHNAKTESQKMTERPRKAHSSSSDSLIMTDTREVILPVRPSDDMSSVGKQRKTEKPVQSVSVSSENDGIVKEITVAESDDMEAHGPVNNAYDRKAAKKRHREEKKMRRKEKKRRKEEKHRRKEEKRAIRVSSKEITCVTPPPRTDRRMKNEEFNSGGQHMVEEEQRKIEDELRRKALDSIRAKKGSSHKM